MPANPNDPRVLASIRTRSGAERIRLGIALQHMTDRIVMAGIRHRNPTWTDAEVQGELTRLIARARNHYNAHCGSPV